MLQLKNSTPFAANIALFPDEAGIDNLYVMVKATFNIGEAWTLVEEQVSPQVEDVYWAEPGQSSLKCGSDFHIGKPTSDIIVMGQACAPDKQSVQQLDVGVAVGQVQKTIRVFGDRQWQSGHISDPLPFTTMPIVYERAYGGQHQVDGAIKSAEVRNLVGCGYAGDRSTTEMDGEPLPNLEDPQQLIQTQNDRPEPACFAFKSPNWQPRAGYVGTYDDVWQKKRAPYLPQDFDKRFFNAAHKDLIYPGFLEGGEPIQITNMNPKGDLNFSVPRINLSTRVHLDKNIEKPAFNLETLILEPNKLQLAMVWKANLACDKKMLKIGDVEVNLSR